MLQDVAIYRLKLNFPDINAVQSEQRQLLGLVLLSLYIGISTDFIEHHIFPEVKIYSIQRGRSREGTHCPKYIFKSSASVLEIIFKID